MARILWLQDINPLASPTGGAQLTDKALIEEGIRRGHSIDICTPKEFGEWRIGRSDFVIISNGMTFPHDWLVRATEKPYAVFHHDFLCKWRAYFPLREKCYRCKIVERWRVLYMHSKLNVFLSPFHREMHEAVVPGLESTNCLEVPSPIDVDRFKPTGERIPGTVIWVGPFVRFKGIHAALAYTRLRPELAYTFAGADVGGIEGEWKDRILAMGHKVLPPIPYQDMPSVLSRYEYLIELPIGPTANERVCAEAWLCGCKLIINANVGFWSWLEKWGLDREVAREEIRRTPERFWRAVEECLA